MTKKTEALKEMAATLEKLSVPEPAEVAFSTMQSIVLVVGVASLVVTAVMLSRLTWLTTHPDDPGWHDAWEGGSSMRPS